jgi:hypothetical protein
MIGTEADVYYTLFNMVGDDVTIIQPIIVFTPYANSEEGKEIDSMDEKRRAEGTFVEGNQIIYDANKSIISFINESEKAKEIRKDLNDFEQIVQSIKFIK